MSNRNTQPVDKETRNSQTIDARTHSSSRYRHHKCSMCQRLRRSEDTHNVQCVHRDFGLSARHHVFCRLSATSTASLFCFYEAMGYCTDASGRRHGYEVDDIRTIADDSQSIRERLNQYALMDTTDNSKSTMPSCIL